MLEVADKIAKLDEVVYLVVVSGRYDIMIEVFCRDHEDLSEIHHRKTIQH